VILKRIAPQAQPPSCSSLPDAPTERGGLIAEPPPVGVSRPVRQIGRALSTIRNSAFSVVVRGAQALAAKAMGIDQPSSVWRPPNRFYAALQMNSLSEDADVVDTQHRFRL